MAVTLTLEQLADHLRIERAAIGAGEPARTILVELMQVGTERVEQYAPDAPRDTQNLAVARFAGYVYDAPSASAGATYGPAFLNSGAVSLLNPWRRAGAGMVHPVPGPPVVTEETDLEPTATPVVTETYYFALKGTQDITAVDLLAGLEITSEPIVENGSTVTQFEIPGFPTGVTMAYMGLAIPHGRMLTDLFFDPNGSTQIATAQFPMQADIVIAGESYSWYESRTTYFNFVIGFDFEMHVEDV